MIDTLVCTDFSHFKLPTYHLSICMLLHIRKPWSNVSSNFYHRRGESGVIGRCMHGQSQEQGIWFQGATTIGLTHIGCAYPFSTL